MPLLLIRHGHVGSAEPTLKTGLSPLGRKQAALIAKRLTGLVVGNALTSDMARASETADFYGARDGRQRTTLIINRALRELHPRLIRPLEHEVSAGKSTRSLQPSVDALVEFVPQLIEMESQGQHIVAFTHGNVIRYLVAHFTATDPSEGWEMNIHNASITEIDFHCAGMPTLGVFDDISHLPKSHWST